MTMAKRHHCHAEGCERIVHAHLLMCVRHWWMVPKAIQHEVWVNYQPGQALKKNPTPAYLAAARKAITAVAQREARA